MVPEETVTGRTRAVGVRPLALSCLVGVALVTAVAGVLLALGAGTRVVRVAGAAATSRDARAVRRERRAGELLAALQPRGLYVTIDTFHNLLKVHNGKRVLREAVCSTGSGTVLIHPSGRRVWVFDTPLGERRVIRKVRDPVWNKPDWAFVEEGFKPPRDPSLRVDRVSLGDYALYLGDGYILHGTLFQTLLGQGVTHGCVRLGDNDLKYVYDTVPVGTRVYLY